jgi:pSer/pThr/pTyr-binding forkhead associated (FHA) protein
MWILQSDDMAGIPVLFRVSPGSIKTVGRAPRADIILDAALVSRLHCRLEANDETIEVIDLESTNGTYVNGSRVSRAHLIPGDRLKVGRVELSIGRSQ